MMDARDPEVQEQIKQKFADNLDKREILDVLEEEFKIQFEALVFILGRTPEFEMFNRYHTAGRTRSAVSKKPIIKFSWWAILDRRQQAIDYYNSGLSVLRVSEVMHRSSSDVARLLRDIRASGEIYLRKPTDVTIKQTGVAG